MDGRGNSHSKRARYLGLLFWGLVLALTLAAADRRAVAQGPGAAAPLRSAAGNEVPPFSLPERQPPAAAANQQIWSDADSRHPTSRPTLLETSRPLTPPEPPQSAATDGGVSLAGSLGTTIVSLAAVVLLILAGARFWKRHVGSVNPRLSREVIEVLGHSPLDQRRTIQLLRVGQRILVLGLSTERLECLGEITDAAEVEMLLGACRSPDRRPSTTLPFRTLLERRLTGASDSGQRSAQHSGQANARQATVESAAALRLMRQLKPDETKEPRHA